MANRIVLNEMSYFGAGAISVLADEIKGRGFKKVLLVTDRDLIKFKVATKVEAVLKGASIAYEIFDDVKQNPTVENVQAGVKAFKNAGADVIVAVGGGSSIDTGKAISIITNNGKYADVFSLEGVAPTEKRGVPLIAIPTTAGTAAEVTINYVITDVAKRRKFVCVDPHDIPILAIVDSQMMESMPKGLKAATGMDALTHAIEGYITKGAWELSDMVELKSIQLIAANLRASVLENDGKAAEQMALGQYIAGMGYSNVGLGAVHGMGHPLGGFYDIPHGVANALLLPYVMAFNAPACGEKFRDIGRAMKVPGIDSMSLEEAQKATVAAVRQLSIDVGVPEKLRELGVKKEDLPALAAAAIADVCTPGNPRDVTEADLLALYEEAF
ncbi:MAG: lactaldehyde reductase [Synergistaceae bacterium]|nr:lactaldehyde reductase [Synergistaceae bacterium]